MGKRKAGDVKRLENALEQSVNPFGKNFPTDHKSAVVRRGVEGYQQGDDLHHNAILEVYSHLFKNLSKEDQLVMIEELQSAGVMPGNNPRNLTPQSRADHLGTDGIHQRLRKKGLEVLSNQERGRGTLIADNGQAMPATNDFFARMEAAPLDERVAAIPDFVEIIQGGMDEEMRAMGFQIPTRAENQQVYRQSVDDEHEQVVQDFLARKVGEIADLMGMPKTGKRRGERIDEIYGLTDLQNRV